MQKYKICPSCRAKNEPMLFECRICEADLTRVKITDEETEMMRAENAPPTTAPIDIQNRVRVCDCGEKNPPNARKCKACGEDISDITPTPEAEAVSIESVPDYVLSSLDGQYAYKITTEEIVVGRENVMSDYLTAKRFVSRTHARITLENGALYIENLSGTNYTYVNNQRISSKTQLEDGDELGLGGICVSGDRQNEAAYFLVRIGKCM